MVRLLDYVLQGPGFKLRYSIMSMVRDTIPPFTTTSGRSR